MKKTKNPLMAQLGCFIAILGILTTVGYYGYTLFSTATFIYKFSMLVFIVGFLIAITSLYIEEFKKRN